MADLPPNPDSNGDTGLGLDHGSPPRTPRWVKVFGIIALALVVLFIIIMLVGGEHGPGRHMPPGGGPGGQTLISSASTTSATAGGYSPSVGLRGYTTVPHYIPTTSVTGHSV